MKLFKQRAITTTRLYFFSFRVINQWNNLPQEIIQLLHYLLLSIN